MLESRVITALCDIHNVTYTTSPCAKGVLLNGRMDCIQKVISALLGMGEITGNLPILEKSASKEKNSPRLLTTLLGNSSNTHSYVMFHFMNINEFTKNDPTYS